MGSSMADADLLERSRQAQLAWLDALREQLEPMRANGELTIRRVLATMKKLKGDTPMVGCERKPDADTFICDWNKRGDHVRVRVARQITVQIQARDKPLIFLGAILTYPRNLGGTLGMGGEYALAHPTFQKFGRAIDSTFKAYGARQLFGAATSELEVTREVPGPDVDIPA